MIRKKWEQDIIIGYNDGVLMGTSHYIVDGGILTKKISHANSEHGESRENFLFRITLHQKHNLEKYNRTKR